MLKPIQQRDGTSVIKGIKHTRPAFDHQKDHQNGCKEKDRRFSQSSHRPRQIGFPVNFLQRLRSLPKNQTLGTRPNTIYGNRRDTRPSPEPVTHNNPAFRFYASGRPHTSQAIVTPLPGGTPGRKPPHSIRIQAVPWPGSRASGLHAPPEFRAIFSKARTMARRSAFPPPPTT